MKPLAVLLAIGLIVFGGLCLHYLSEEDRAHHAEWAAETGLPAPAPWIRRLGWFSMAGGVVLVGYAFLQRRMRTGSRASGSSKV